jgi:hypothetical protein
MTWSFQLKDELLQTRFRKFGIQRIDTKLDNQRSSYEYAQKHIRAVVERVDL